MIFFGLFINDNKKHNCQKMELFETPKHKTLILNSSKIPIQLSKIYEWKIVCCPISGTEKSALALIFFYDDEQKLILKRYKFFKNYSGKEQTLTLRCEVPLGSKFATLGFRINCAGAKPHDTKIKLPNIKQCVLSTTDNKEESYDKTFDYVEQYEKTDLDKEPWKAVGGRRHFTGEEIYYPQRLSLLKAIGLLPNSTILDFGCGTGSLIKDIHSYIESPKNYVGIDFVQKAIDYCKKKYPEFEFLRNEQLTKLPNLDRKFDMICLFSVFTHMYPNEIKDILMEMKQFLKNGGTIVITVNINQFISSFIGTRQRIEMTEKQFLDSVESAGFSKITRIPGRESGLQTIYQIQH